MIGPTGTDAPSPLIAERHRCTALELTQRHRLSAAAWSIGR